MPALTAPPEPRQLGLVNRVAGAMQEDGIGFYVALLLVYPFFEYGRPANPLSIPMVLSSLLFMGWVCARNKTWHPQVAYFFVLIAHMCFGTVLAVNTYSAFWQTYSFTVTLVGTCIPLIHFVTSFRKLTAFIHALVGAFLYVALYAMSHNGVGPGWQDENYVAAAMCMAFPFAYFSIFLARRVLTKVLFAVLSGIFVTTVIVSYSRGGFLGLAVVPVHCILRSPKASPVYLVGPALAATIAVSATPAYWTEMKSIGDIREKTIEFRLDLWTIALRMFEDNPIAGVGPGNFVWNAGDVPIVGAIREIPTIAGG